ncbi:MAG TPA: tetratricopeptide repeat protein, partial [Thermoanaerobaculia bacterium]|nr:tetratricopeptide repeat protein [Thermoanaerobaculia bacterium]
MKIQKTAVLLAFLTACSRGEVPAGAEQDSQPAQPSQPSAQTAPAQPDSPDAQAPQRQLTPTEQKVQEAFGLIEKGDANGAIRILEVLHAQKQATPPVISLLGAVYLQEGRPKDALNVLRPLAEGEDADPAVLYNAGRAALAAGDAAAGQRFLERSVAKAPVSPAARELGLLLSRQGRVIEAYRQLRLWALNNADDLEARIIAATLALRLERPADAEEILSGLAEKEPAIQLLRAQARIQRGDGKTALAMLQPIEKDHP